MGFLFVVFWAIAAYLFYIDSSSLFVISLVLAALNFWSLGILYNYKNNTYTPRIWGGINVLTSIASIVFLLFAFIS